ncbi:alpha-tocopherol transfer protein [Solenopsis invicta]|uniref:alpha-tocopherol transfer protein n=1 Tax=Solenopsis invicta TaxID=13686 RepID=UPI000E33FA89|nr:alpha-tocopherol transfer protein [Solenopsis invicta]XP_039313962.1 alpha-tocopherol transfer protein [Solenopsis invicta]XP_039313963.1 alpha-tocopherol transfer protein [Solenopsis invicta]
MSSGVKENVKPTLVLPNKQEMYEHWQKNAPKIKFGEHTLTIEISEEIDEFFVQKAKEELRETPEVVAESLAEFKELLAGEPNLYLPDMDDIYKIFLRPCKWYPKSAFSLMKRYFRFRLNYPNIYSDLLITKEKAAFHANLIYPLPLRTKEGSRILIMECGKRWKPKEVSTYVFFRGLILILFLAFVEHKTQIAGGHIILDAEGLSLGHVTYITPSFAKMMVEFIQKCLPFRLKGIHIVNQSFIFNMVFTIFKPFLEEKIRKRIHFHGTNWESLRASLVADKKTILKKHGGDMELPEGPYGEMLWQNMLSCAPAYEADQQYGYVTEKEKM